MRTRCICSDTRRACVQLSGKCKGCEDVCARTYHNVFARAFFAKRTRNKTMLFAAAHMLKNRRRFRRAIEASVEELVDAKVLAYGHTGNFSYARACLLARAHTKACAQRHMHVRGFCKEVWQCDGNFHRGTSIYGFVQVFGRACAHVCIHIRVSCVCNRMKVGHKLLLRAASLHTTS